MQNPSECQWCGETMPTQDERMRIQKLMHGGPYHTCRGTPSVATIRRIIREEIEAALKRHELTAEDLK